MSYAEWDAAVECGATLDELQKWDAGGYTARFKAKVITFVRYKRLIEMHSEEASRKKPRGSKF